MIAFVRQVRGAIIVSVSAGALMLAMAVLNDMGKASPEPDGRIRVVSGPDLSLPARVQASPANDGDRPVAVRPGGAIPDLTSLTVNERRDVLASLPRDAGSASMLEERIARLTAGAMPGLTIQFVYCADLLCEIDNVVAYNAVTIAERGAATLQEARNMGARLDVQKILY